MKEIWEVYTNDQTLSNKAVNRFVDQAKQLNGYNFDEIARYVYQNDNGENILIECQVPCKDAIEFDEDCKTYLMGYEFDGDINDYMATREVICEVFNGDWGTLKQQMMTLAKT